jgi:hypothetical protein
MREKFVDPTLVDTKAGNNNLNIILVTRDCTVALIS